MGPAHMLTFDLTAGETYPLLVNALTEYAVVLDRQSAEQSAGENPAYARALSQTAAEARRLVGRIVAAHES